ncbi:TolC family protein [Dongia soli]|uniref:TolC family protein n=1 Tax=Dongia soli TaxID=600628 RepID=A0ABU5EJH6_9PROT|nr:TolC family protein [Dongia soli]MDY0885877.1 TolC family protein [Dongia soli]
MRSQLLWLGPSAMLVASLVLSQPAVAQPTDNLLGATVDDLLAAAHQLSPNLRAATLDTAAMAAKAEGAGKLDDPTISDSYQYYKDPGVFSAHTVMMSQAFPLWGKRSLRREAALADVDATRGQERAAQDELDEKIKVAYAQYFLINQSLKINHEIFELASHLREAATVRFKSARGDQSAIIQAMGEETAAKLEAVRLQGDLGAARANINALVGRAGNAPLADPVKLRATPGAALVVSTLVERAHAGNPNLSASDAAVAAAKTRSKLANKAWYPDLTVSAGPIIQTNNMPVGFAATLGFNIPVPWGREASGQHEAAAQLGASEQRFNAALFEIEGALGESVAKLQAARSAAQLLRHETVPQAKAMFQTVLADYSQGKADLTATIAAQRQIHDVELRLLQNQLDEQVELAAIERLTGGDL